MEARPLKTDNRFLRAGLSESVQVSLGRAVSEMAKMPTTGANLFSGGDGLLSRKFEQVQASLSALTTSQRERLAELDLNLRQLGGDSKQVTPITNLESYMANKG